MNTEIFERPPATFAVGYSALVERHGLKVLPHHRWSFIAERGSRRELSDGRFVLRLDLDPLGMSDVDHLLFALKHDGSSLEILAAFVADTNQEAFEDNLTTAIRNKPTGKYHRQLWFLYEWLTGRRLAVNDLEVGNYVPLLDDEDYYTGPVIRSRRQRVVNNMLGTPGFCPVIRRTEELSERSSETLAKHIREIVSDYDPDVLARALSYLYTKETMSSFAIERETPKPKRAERFANLLKRVSELGALSEAVLAELQSSIVDPRFAEEGFRTVQNYVGESVGLHRQLVHYVSPRPEDVGDLMAAWFEAVERMEEVEIDPVVWAACASFGFVFVHPFADGNGRLHRFLIHYVLARRGLTPAGMVIPVSAVMLAKRGEYDACLEKLSKPLLPLIEYEIHDDGSLDVLNETANHYRYFDATPMAEYLHRWLDEAVHEDLRAELDFLVGLRKTRAEMSAVVDLPDRLANLFVKVCLANGGRLSKTKRDSHFDMLTDEEVAALERAVNAQMPSRFVSDA